MLSIGHGIPCACTQVQISGSSLSIVQAFEMFYMRMLFFTCSGVVPGIKLGPPCLTKVSKKG